MTRSPTPALMRTFVQAGILLAISCQTVTAQSETALRAMMEGRKVTLKVSMPATSYGIDVYPEKVPKVDWSMADARQKEYGTALVSGNESIITRIVIKDDHIEVQLGGGGAGKVGRGTLSVKEPGMESESARERVLRDSITMGGRGQTVAARQQAELRQLQEARRKRDAARREASTKTDPRELQKAIAERAKHGSRFNIWFEKAMPQDALTPAAVMTALAEYVDFSASRIRGAR